MSSLDQISRINEIKQQGQEGAPLTPDYVAKLIYFSFLLSQGSPELQSNFFKYFHVVRPDWAIDEKDTTQLTEASISKAKTFVRPDVPTGSGHVPQPSMEKEIDDQVLSLMDALRAKKIEQPKEHIMKVLAFDFLERDLTYIAKPRPTSPNEYQSHICKYILGSKKTSVAEYDQMLSELKPVILSKEWREKLKQVVTAYNLSHPEKIVDLEALTKEVIQ